MLRSRSDEVRVGHGQDMGEPLSVSERFMLDGDLYLDYDTPRASRWVWSKWRSWVRSWTRSDMAMAGMSLGLFACMSFYFYIPSSLYIYVTCVCFTAPAMLVTTLMRRLRTRRTDQKKRLQVTGVITAFVLACLVRDLFFSASVPRHWRTPRTSTYYIASLLHNSEAILPHYSRSLLHLAKDLGPSNVYVSIYENDSHDRTPALLRTLDQQLQSLGVSTHIVTDTQSKDTRQKDRIERLATYRNLAMAPLNEALGGMLHGKPFDKVIWINDVFFESDTVHALLDTEGGEFDQACAMDFCWLGFYDTWVMRDADGKTMRPFWPYFRATQDQAAVRMPRRMRRFPHSQRRWPCRPTDPCCTRTPWTGPRRCRCPSAAARRALRPSHCSRVWICIAFRGRIVRAFTSTPTSSWRTTGRTMCSTAP